MSSAGFLTLALLLPAAPPAGPNLQRGDELIYTGSVTEAVDRPGMRFRRTHELQSLDLSKNPLSPEIRLPM